MRYIFILVILISPVLASCSNEADKQLDIDAQEGSQATKADKENEDILPVPLTLLTHDSFAISEAILREFENEYHVELVLLPAGDTGAVLSQAILTKDNPLADLFYGVDNAFMSRALNEDIFVPYVSPALNNVSDELLLDDSNHLTPVNYGDVCLNYDISWFGDRGIAPPQNLSDLTKSEYMRLTVVENPATSSPGLAFLLATVDAFGTKGEYNYLDYWRDLRSNEVLVTDGWENAYFGQFSAAGDGDRPIVVSYASSPSAEVVFADPPIDEPITGSVTSSKSCFRQIEFIGILKGTKYQQLAQKFVDFMLSKSFQEDIPLNMFVFPANENAILPDVFVQWADIPETPASVLPNEIEANREEWIEAWTEVVLR
jgi:thiamine transport system substrate-binding protein